jgi:hypothetical protein
MVVCLPRDPAAEKMYACQIPEKHGEANLSRYTVPPPAELLTDYILEVANWPHRLGLAHDKSKRDSLRRSFTREGDSVFEILLAAIWDDDHAGLMYENIGGSVSAARLG